MLYAPNIALPPQMIPLKKKDENWQKENADRLHMIARQQLMENLLMLENYQIVRGKFMYHHYLEDNNYHDLVQALTQEFSVPKHLRHYDIISQVINLLVGEYDKRPDLFRAQAMDENTGNIIMRQKAKYALDYVLSEINNDIERQLVEMGLDPAREDFESEEEMQAYQQEVEQQRTAMRPEAIEKYMKTDFMTAAELWANNRIAADNQKFRRNEKDKVEFEDMLTVAMCFRHFAVRGGKAFEETWNPINVFKHTSPEVEWVQEGDYVGRTLYLSPGAIIDICGDKMSLEQIEALEQTDHDNYYTQRKTSPTFKPEAYVIPYENFEVDERLRNLAGIDSSGIITVQDHEMQGSNYNMDNRGLIEFVEGYWKSFRKVAMVTYEDPEDGIVKTTWVDENFIVPKFFKVVKVEDIDDVEDMTNTVVWTWQPQVWQFKKIIATHTRLEEDIYIDVRPCDFQFKGDEEMYGALLPVCGRVINNRNSNPMSLVDLMKPHQIGHNLAMNQGYEIMSREVGRFMLYDPNFLPLWKGWAGEDGFEKLMLMAKALGAAPADASTAARKGSGSFSHFQMVDLDETTRILSRMKLAEAFEQRALAQVGITPQRLGSVTASETAEGTQTATTQSFAQTEKWFIKFSEYKQRCLTMGLQLAQFVEANETDGTVTYINSDMSRAFIKFIGTDLLLASFYVFIHNSQELIRQLEVARQLAINNPNTGADVLDLFTLATSLSPKEIKRQLEVSTAKRDQMAQQQNDIAQQQIDLQREEAANERAWQSEENRLDREADLEGEYISTFGFNKNNSEDSDNNGVRDMLEYDKLMQKQSDSQSKQQLETRKQNFAEEESKRKERIEILKMRQDDRELNSRERLAKMKMKQDRNKPKPKKKK